ncbi:pyridoxamine 5-phosphate oxidase [Nostocales cyanobacterium HT-58-2]|nr:pyridoxamine 5-phosphate oxidase [Nostocales cyanobacterium HT-58-2]
MSQFETALAAYQGFTDLFQSLVISTVSADGIPNASYAPFVMDESKNIYIYVSGLSSHTQNLHAVPRAGVLFIEDESQTKQIFARRRLTFDCTATLIERDTEVWNQIVDRFEARFGEMIQLLRDLPDFRIFKLIPIQGRFVIGFGAAYEVDPNNFSTLTHITAGGK